ncbi:MAG: PorV/PorQ family protein [bacterium]
MIVKSQPQTPIRAIIIFTALLIASTLQAQIGIAPSDIERVGQSGWQFLKINGDPWPAAMGGAFTAISRGNANAVLGNPAALANVEHFDLQLNRVSWIADITYQSAAFATNLSGFGAVALSVVTLDYGDMAETVNSFLETENRTEAVVTGRFFSARDMAAGLSYARRITDKLSIGGNLRWLRQEIAELSMNNWSLDFGTMYYTGLKSLRLAMTARNFGPDAHLVGWSEEYQAEPDDIRMPIDFRVGVAMDFLHESGGPHFMTVVLEGDHPNDGQEKFHIGVDYTFEERVSLRGGYKINYDEQSFTFGGGANHTLRSTKVQVNYAYVDFGALKQVHMFSFGLSF